MRQIYLDHASTTPVRPEVVEAMTPYFTEHFGNPSSIYPLGQEASDAVAAARESLAGLIGAAAARDLLHERRHRIGQLGHQGLRPGQRRQGAPHHHERHRAPRRAAHLPGVGARGLRGDLPARGRARPRERGGFQGGHPPGHHPGLHHVRQQRDRHHRACSPAGGGCPRSERRLPHRRGAGLRPRAHRRERAGHRYAVGLFPQDLRPQGRRAFVRAPWREA